MSGLTEAGALEIVERLGRVFAGSGEAIPSVAEVKDALGMLSQASRTDSPDVPATLDSHIASELVKAANKRAMLANDIRQAEADEKVLMEQLPHAVKVAIRARL